MYNPSCRLNTLYHDYLQAPITLYLLQSTLREIVQPWFGDTFILHILSTIVKSAMKVRAHILCSMKRSGCGEIVAHFFKVSLKFSASILEPGDNLCV